FSFDKVKVDRSFVSALGKDSQSEHIVRAILNMCTALDLDVIAEGIETAEQAQKLVQLGCKSGQGYYFGRPADAATTLAYFDKAAETGETNLA
ncbi:MAG: EAL domain-containing protein, partial [Oricola sp.]